MTAQLSPFGILRIYYGEGYALGILKERQKQTIMSYHNASTCGCNARNDYRDDCGCNARNDDYNGCGCNDVQSNSCGCNNGCDNGYNNGCGNGCGCNRGVLSCAANGLASTVFRVVRGLDNSLGSCGCGCNNGCNNGRGNGCGCN